MNSTDPIYVIQPMQKHEIDAVCELIDQAMSAEEARRARKTFDFHFACMSQELDDGRRYFTYSHDGRIAALTGLHHYAWGPAENVWLSWFAVHPEFQRQGIGSAILKQTEVFALERGYRKLFIETYDHSDFAVARQFYTACGFESVGNIENYLSDASRMMVYLKLLN